MKGVRELKRRLKGVANIQKITRAMEMVATTKLRRMQDRALATRPYADSIEAMMGRVAVHADEEKTPLLRVPPTVTDEALIVVGADKGLCGSYNSNLFRAGVAHLRSLDGVKPHLCLFGKRAQGFFGRIAGIELTRIYPETVERVGYDDVRRALKELTEGFMEGRFQRVSVLSTRMQSMAKFVPRVQTLLPIPRPDPDAKSAGGVDYILEPSPQEIMDRLLPRYLEMQLFAAVLEALACEFAARRMAMKNATDAADDMIGILTKEYNKARQWGITAELLDIVGGSEAQAG